MKQQNWIIVLIDIRNTPEPYFGKEFAGTECVKTPRGSFMKYTHKLAQDKEFQWGYFYPGEFVLFVNQSRNMKREVYYALYSAYRHNSRMERENRSECEPEGRNDTGN